MTPDERLEALLNRAGQTISDLPRVNGIGMPYGVDRYEPLLKEASDFIQFNAPAGFEVFNVIQYALHLTDIIDRMETALENFCGERDYLVWALKKDYPCDVCIHRNKYGFEKPCDICERANSKFEFAGVPEDWSVDDV